ncbi:hypothetical protein F5884DRAFT_860543 [Xylogone sp. PMI_703]|nr:hypothetical protein F5884DRAFT_860543 [Xylogone sp. PMI_703]
MEILLLFGLIIAFTTLESSASTSSEQSPKLSLACLVTRPPSAEKLRLTGAFSEDSRTQLLLSLRDAFIDIIAACLATIVSQSARASEQKKKI